MSKMDGWDSRLKTHLRRFERITDNDEDIQAFVSLVEEKDLTGTDLGNIFKVIRVRPGNEKFLK